MKNSLSLMLILMSVNISAGVQRSIVLDREVSNTDCQRNNSCSLKKFSVQISDYVVTRNKEQNFGTNAYISYETESVKHLEDYAVVQFIKGCVYNESIDKNGKRVKRRGISRKFFDSYAPFIHSDWEIDSIDKDPIYNSSTVNDSRHEYYRWNENPNSFSENNEHYLLREYPTYPKLYVSDLPSTSFRVDNEAKNTNLAFKTCIYKTAEIPRELGPTDIKFAEPLHCIEWKTSYVYNFETKKFDRDKSIEESCDDL